MSLLEDIQQGFTNAIDDIRHSVVEQGWFGQDTSGDISSSADISTPEIDAPAIELSQSEESIIEMFTPPAEAEQELVGQEQEIEGMDI